MDSSSVPEPVRNLLANIAALQHVTHSAVHNNKASPSVSSGAGGGFEDGAEGSRERNVGLWLESVKEAGGISGDEVEASGETHVEPSLAGGPEVAATDRVEESNQESFEDEYYGLEQQQAIGYIYGVNEGEDSFENIDYESFFGPRCDVTEEHCDTGSGVSEAEHPLENKDYESCSGHRDNVIEEQPVMIREGADGSDDKSCDNDSIDSFFEPEVAYSHSEEDLPPLYPRERVPAFIRDLDTIDAGHAAYGPFNRRFTQRPPRAAEEPCVFIVFLREDLQHLLPPVLLPNCANLLNMDRDDAINNGPPAKELLDWYKASRPGTLLPPPLVPDPPAPGLIQAEYPEVNFSDWVNDTDSEPDCAPGNGVIVEQETGEPSSVPDDSQERLNQTGDLQFPSTARQLHPDLAAALPRSAPYNGADISADILSHAFLIGFQGPPDYDQELAECAAAEARVTQNVQDLQKEYEAHGAATQQTPAPATTASDLQTVACKIYVACSLQHAKGILYSPDGTYAGEYAEEEFQWARQYLKDEVKVWLKQQIKETLTQ